MQAEKRSNTAIHVPEYYLLWTFDHSDFLVKHLKTWNKLPLEFYDKGVPNNDNGPDYRHALIKVGDTLMRGDIEFHREWQDWFRHGHENDFRYNQVILHVLWSSPKNLPVTLAKRFPHFIMSEHLSITQNRWLQAMNLLKNQNSPVDVLTHRLKISGVDSKKLAWKRFLRKSLEMRNWANQFGWEMSLYMGLAKALGYNKNSHPFVQLVRTMPPFKLISSLHPVQRSPLIFWILLAWQAGLLERPLRNYPRPSPSFSDKLINHLKRQFCHVFTLPQQNLIHWNFARLRPFNNPYNRLAGFSQILFHYHNHSLFKILLEIHMKRNCLNQLLEEVKKILYLPLSSDFKPFSKQLLGSGILAEHSMGPHRCLLFHLNILLPLFYIWAGANQSPGFARYLEDIYFQFPAVDENSRLQSLVKGINNYDLKNAYMQQALLEYHQLNFVKQQLIIQKMH